MTDATAVSDEMAALLSAAIRYVDSYASNSNNHPQARDVARDLEAKIKATLSRSPATEGEEGKCAGGEVPTLDGSQCKRCGATEDDACQYERPTAHVSEDVLRSEIIADLEKWADAHIHDAEAYREERGLDWAEHMTRHQHCATALRAAAKRIAMRCAAALGGG